MRSARGVAAVIGQVGDGTTTDALSPSTVTGPTAVSLFSVAATVRVVPTPFRVFTGLS